MRIMILDDSKYKREDIKDYLKSDNIEFLEFSCARDFLALLQEERRKTLKKESSLFDEPQLLFLDMCFPFYENDMPNPNEGEIILSEIKRRNLPIYIVFSSSDTISIEDDKVLGSITYNSSCFQKEEFEEYIEIFKEVISYEGNS